MNSEPNKNGEPASCVFRLTAMGSVGHAFVIPISRERSAAIERIMLAKGPTTGTPTTWRLSLKGVQI